MEEFITQFHFIRPLWLLLAIPAIFLFILLLRSNAQNSEWRSIVDSHLLPYLIHGASHTTSHLPLYGVLAMWLLGTVALAGPAWKKLPQPLRQDVSALVILWDMSPSMNATDLKPSRLIRSRLKLIDLLNERREGMAALIAYAGDAHIVTPLTDDNQTIVNLLPSLSPEIMPLRGSNPEMALEQAQTLLHDTGVTSGDILFVTDGIDPAALPEMKHLHTDSQHKITIWGIGTEEGAPIPVSYGGFAQDDNNNIIFAKLDESQLNDVANELDGLYVPFTNNELDINTILNFSLNSNAKESRETTRIFDKWFEHGPYLLLLLIPFVALTFRRGWLLSVMFVVALFPEHKAFAYDWEQLWKTPDQRGVEKLNAGDAEQAAQLFANPDWKAIAEYKAKDFESAAEKFNAGQTAKDYYNHGNALTHLGKYDEAIAAFDKALNQQQDFDEAEYNKAIAEKLKQLQEQQQQNNQNQDNNNQDSQSQDQNQDSQSQNQQSQQQNSQQQNSQQQESQQQDSQDQNQAQNQSEQSQSGDSEQQANADQQQEQENQQQRGEQEKNELTEEQQQALDRKYNSSQQEGEEQPEQQAAQQEQEQEKDPQENGEQQMAQAVKPMENEEMTEEQQAMEQWLRKVPDDPSGLMRNKLKYEYNQMRRAYRRGEWRPPENDATKRW